MRNRYEDFDKNTLIMALEEAMDMRISLEEELEKISPGWHSRLQQKVATDRLRWAGKLMDSYGQEADA